jgi:hypothetical protein
MAFRAMSSDSILFRIKHAFVRGRGSDALDTWANLSDTDDGKRRSAPHLEHPQPPMLEARGDAFTAASSPALPAAAPAARGMVPWLRLTAGMGYGQRRLDARRHGVSGPARSWRARRVPCPGRSSGCPASRRATLEARLIHGQFRRGTLMNWADDVSGSKSKLSI